MDFLNALGKPMRLSASAAETWLDCKRKWAYGYYWRVARVSSPAAEVGNKVHDILETYLDLGEKPEEPNNRYWRIAEPGLQFLPEVRTDAPNPGNNGVVGNWKVEEWVKCECGPLPFVGKVDLYNLTDFDNIQVDDHKTTGDSSWRWAKTPNQLAKLIQPHAYAWSLVQVHGLTPPKSVDFRHIYYATRGEPKAMEVRAPNVPWEDIESTWKQLEIMAGQMAELSVSIVTPEDVEATTSSCKKFGGCPYADRCAASPVNRSKHRPTTIQVSRSPEMSDRLTALRAQLGISKKQSPPQVESEPTTLPPIKDPQGDPEALAEKLLGIIQSFGEERMQVSTAEAMAKSADVYLYEAMKIANLMNVNGFLVPKELSMTEAHNITAKGSIRPRSNSQKEEEEYQAAAEKYRAKMQAETDAEETRPSSKSSLELLTISRGEDVAQVLTQWDAHLEANGHRMFRKDAQAIVRDVTGAQRVRKERILHYIEQFNEAYVAKVITLQGNLVTMVTEDNYTTATTAKDLEVTPSSTEVTPSVISKPDALLPTTDPEDTPLGRIVKEVATPTIYIDCIPEDPAGVYSFTDFIRPFEQEVEKDGGMVDKKFMQPLPYYGLIDYGKGPGTVAGKVLAALHRSGPQLLRGDMYVDGKHPLADEIIPILRRLKGVRVVRASR
tara:strand:- start:8887 stop:10884 length:1998 start_codon:yes stop_codon:yes gene_type:complete